MLVDLRDVGYIEVSGLEDASSTVAKAVHEFLDIGCVCRVAPGCTGAQTVRFKKTR